METRQLKQADNLEPQNGVGRDNPSRQPVQPDPKDPQQKKKLFLPIPTTTSRNLGYGFPGLSTELEVIPASIFGATFQLVQVFHLLNCGLALITSVPQYEQTIEYSPPVGV